MVIRYLDIERPRCVVWPFKTDAPLPVDSDAELSLSVAADSFKAIAAQSSKVIQRCCRVQYGQPFFGLLFESLKSSNQLTGGKRFCFLAPIINNRRLSAYTD